MDLDHAGGLSDFPQARVHVHGPSSTPREHPTLKEQRRYIPAQWAHGPKWVPHRDGGDDWFGFPPVTALGDDVVIVPLHGPQPRPRRRRGRGRRRRLAAPRRRLPSSTGDKQTPRVLPARAARFQTAARRRQQAAPANHERLQELYAAHADEVTVFCAHDASEFAALRSRRLTSVAADRERQVPVEDQLGGGRGSPRA